MKFASFKDNKSYSYDVDDACGLTHAVLLGGTEDIASYLQSHIEDIEQYNPEHPAIPKLKQLLKDAIEFNLNRERAIEELIGSK